MVEPTTSGQLYKLVWRASLVFFCVGGKYRVWQRLIQNHSTEVNSFVMKIVTCTSFSPRNNHVYARCTDGMDESCMGCGGRILKDAADVLHLWKSLLQNELSVDSVTTLSIEDK